MAKNRGPGMFTTYELVLILFVVVDVLLVVARLISLLTGHDGDAALTLGLQVSVTATLAALTYTLHNGI